MKKFIFNNIVNLLILFGIIVIIVILINNKSESIPQSTAPKATEIDKFKQIFY